MANKGRPTRSTPVQTIPTDQLIDILNDLKRISRTTDKKKKWENIETVAKKCEQIDNAIAIYNGMVELQKRREYDEKQQMNRTPEPNSKLQELLEKCREDNKKLTREIDALKLRLSEVVGVKIVENNPVIADLSDPYRPTSLAEQFKQVYDEEWVNAFEDLDRMKFGEAGSLAFLVDIIKRVNVFCGKAMQDMTERIGHLALDDVAYVKVKTDRGLVPARTRAEPSEGDIKISERIIKRYLKDLCHLATRGLVEVFDTIHLKPMLEHHRMQGNYNGINGYAKKVVEYVWRMHLADPPMALKWQEKGSPVSKEISVFYTKTGHTVAQPVWPTVLLHEGGPVISKGVVRVE